MYEQYEQIERLFRSLDSFKRDSKNIFKYLKEQGVNLNFSGYSELIDDIYNLDPGDFESVFNVCKNILLWREYLGTLKQRIGAQVTSCENKIAYLEAFIDYDRENKKLNTLIDTEKAAYLNCKYYFNSLDEQLKLLRKIYKYTQYRYEELCKEGIRQS